jgi:hypothetical protein
VLGDFVGGYIGTIFSLTSIVLLYSTLKNQRQSSTIEKFETKYFELVRLHRENVDEVSIGNDKGRKIFVILIREFRSILEIVKQLASEQKQNLPLNQLLIISYYVLFYGVGPNSSRMLKEALRDFDAAFISELDRYFNSDDVKKNAKEEKKFKFTPFEGHQSRLGHYYRHLYQTVCYVDIQATDIDKYEYVKTLRAQLTTHEQALLLINSLTPIGRKWWEKDLITRYKLVQNLPRAFFDKTSEIDTESMFPSDYFEWQET